MGRLEAKHRGSKEAKFSLMSGAVHYVHGLTTLHTVCMIIFPLFNTGQSSMSQIQHHKPKNTHGHMCVCLCVCFFFFFCLAMPVSELISPLEDL